MSSKPRFDPLGLAEIDSTLGEDAAPPAVPGMPADRAARIAARSAFVEMKLLFLRSVENLDHRKAAWLRTQVRGAEDPVDLWLLRGPLLAALREDDRTRNLRAELYRSLDATFPQVFSTPLARPAPPVSHAWQVPTIVEAKFSDAR